jgi:chromate reductase
MTTYQVGYFVGSLSSTSINRVLSRALIRLAPEELEFKELPIGNLPLYSQDYDPSFPPEAVALKEAITGSDAILFVTPEYNRSIPGALKNAIDWASRPWGRNSFDNLPAAVIGASVGQIGTAMAQQSLRGVLSFCNAPQMTTPAAYIKYSPEVFSDDGEVRNDSQGLPAQLYGRVPHLHRPRPHGPATSLIRGRPRFTARCSPRRRTARGR